MKPEVLKSIQQSIIDNEKFLAEMREDIIKARKGGIDVSDSEKAYSELVKKVALLKSAYLT
jgi:hypothetical protein